VLHKVAKENKVELETDMLDKFLGEVKTPEEVKAKTKASVLDLMKYPNLRRKSFIIFFLW
jgi:OCT family organic cation transporter-like MFS transporter 4/5